jgi:gliding motility-associated-like protein
MKYFLPLTFLLLTALGANAQFAVTNNTNAASLAQKIVGPGITILNPVFKGSAISAGFFVDGTGRLGIDSGIILTSGRASTFNNIKGANAAADGIRTSDLSSYAGVATNDACILEFDFVPQGDSIKVKFVFASDEYQGATSQQIGYICSNINDAFAFLISGPGIAGNQNIALVPGTNIPVAINTINNGRPKDNNETQSSANCTAYGSGSPFTNLYVDNKNGADISYNGLTTVLLARAKLLPCNVYHIKLVIADGFDDIIDSGVFIEASSFSSNGISASSSGGFTDTQNNSIAVEGCRNAQVKIQLANPPSTALTLPLSYSGTASFGVDYAAMPASIVFGVNETQKLLDIVVLTDNIAEPTESIIISIGNNACSNTPASSVTVLIKDSISFVRVKDTFVCSQFPTLLSAPYSDTASNKYLWSNGGITRQTNAFVPGNYWAVHTFSNNCYNIDSFHVINGDPLVSVGNDVSICNKDSVLVTASVQLQPGGSYLWSTNETLASIYLKNSGHYSVKYTAPNGCYMGAGVNAIAKPLPYANLGNDTSLCSDESLQLNAYYPNASYVWSTGSTNPSITVSDDGLYIVASSLNGCEVKDSVVVARKNSPIANAGLDTAILTGGTAKLVALQHPNNDQYEWFPNAVFNYPNAYNPYASPTVTGPVYLKVTSRDNCIAMDTLLITVKDYLLNIPNAFSPNGDGVNDTWQIPLFSSYIFSKVQVFNRGGQVVFSSVGYDMPWDGTLNGKPLPTGTYYYVIEPGMGRTLRTGSVTILK